MAAVNTHAYRGHAIKKRCNSVELQERKRERKSAEKSVYQTVKGITVIQLHSGL